MELTVIKRHNKLKSQRLMNNQSSFIMRILSYLTTGLFIVISIIHGWLFADIIVKTDNIYSSIIILTSVVLFIDAAMKLLLVNPKIESLHPYLVLPISKKRIILGIILENLFDIRNYISLLCIISISMILYSQSLIDLLFILKYIFISIGFLLFNSCLSITMKNFSLVVTLLSILICIVYFFVLLSFAKEKWELNLLSDFTVNFFESILFFLFSATLYIYIIHQTIINNIFENSLKNKENYLSFIEKILDINKEVSFVIKLFFRGKPFSYWCIFPLIAMPLLFFKYYNSNDIIMNCIVLLFGSSIFSRYINVHKLISYYADGLITQSSLFFRKLLSGLYITNVFFAIYWSVIMYLYVRNIFLSLDCLFLSMGIGGVMNIVFTVYDSGRYSIYTPVFNGQNILYLYTNKKANVIYFTILIGTIVFCYLLFNFLSAEIMTSIIAAQGLIIFFTKKFWLNKLNDIYMKNRYENLAKCRGEKFYN